MANVTRLDAWRCNMNDKELEIHNKKMDAKYRNVVKFLDFETQYGDAVYQAKLLQKELSERPKIKRL